jgi:hypothetical protein
MVVVLVVGVSTARARDVRQWDVPSADGTNVTFMIREGNKGRGSRENQVAEFSEGNFLNANVRVPDDVKSAASGKKVTFTSRLFGGADALLAEKSWTVDYDGGSMVVLDPIPKPQMVKGDHWTSQFARALSKLPEGTYGLTYTVEMSFDGRNMPLARGVMQYKSTGKGDYAGLADLLAAKTGETDASAGAAALGVKLHLSGGTDAGAAPVESFKAGEPIFLHANFDKPMLGVLDPDAPDMVYFVIHLAKDGKDLGYYSFGVRMQHLLREREAGQNGRMVMPIVSDPEGVCEVYNNSLFNSRLPAVLAELPPGNHTIDYRLESSHPLIADTPLAKGSFELEVTDAGREALRKNAEESTAAAAQRGGEVVVEGLRLRANNGLRMVVTDSGRVRSTRGGGRFEGDKFVIGLFKVGELYSDRYEPDTGSAPLFIERGEGGAYLVKRSGQTVATITSTGKVLKADGAEGGEIYNEFEKISSPADLRQLVTGLHHFSDLFR